jgi:hypothetical protein
MNSNSEIDAVLEALRENGYLASTVHNNGATRVQVDGSAHHYHVTDFATDTRQYFRDPTVSVAVLEFEVSDASPLATKFVAELLKLIAPADSLFKKHVRPLVRTTPTTLHAIYQADTRYAGLCYGAAHRQLFEHGLAFPDSPNRCARVAQLHAHCGGAPLEGGTWLNGATPLTVKRAELPAWNPEDTSARLRQLVDRLIAAGEVRECEPYSGPRKVYDNDTDGHADLYERAGLKIVHTDDDVPAPMEYADERLREAFGANSGGTPTGNGFAMRRRG